MLLQVFRERARIAAWPVFLVLQLLYWQPWTFRTLQDHNILSNICLTPPQVVSRSYRSHLREGRMQLVSPDRRRRSSAKPHCFLLHFWEQRYVPSTARSRSPQCAITMCFEAVSKYAYPSPCVRKCYLFHSRGRRPLQEVVSPNGSNGGKN